MLEERLLGEIKRLTRLSNGNRNQDIHLEICFSMKAF